jgi:beta-lactamase class A
LHIAFMCLALLLSVFCKASASHLLEQSIKQITQSVPGVFGISTLHLESGQRIEINADQAFPMASSYKLPIACYCLELLDADKIDGMRKRVITKTDMRRYSCVTPGQRLTAREMMQLMIEKSCNATTDIILKMVGGGNKVTQWLQTKGIKGMQIDRSTLKMIADYSGIPVLGDENKCTNQRYMQLLKKVPKKQSTAAAKKFYTDKRDTTTPRAMLDLFVRLHQGKLLGKDSTKFLLHSLEHYTRAQKRIIALLPKNTKVWQKSGTMDGVISNSAIIKLPHGKGHLALAIFTNNSVTHMLQREQAMAKIAKLLFDHFSKTPMVH